MTSEARQPLSANPNRHAFGEFLDAVPAGLYVVAHTIFLTAAVALWMRAGGTSFAYARPIFALYGASQLGFFGYFAGRITMKTAVLVEQTLVLALVVLVALSA